MWSVANPGLWFEGGLSQAAKGKKQQELSLQVSIWESFGRGSSHVNPESATVCDHPSVALSVVCGLSR